MRITYTGQNLKVSPEVKRNMEEKISRLDKYSSKIVEAHVILKKEKIIYRAEISVLARKIKAVGHGKSGINIFAAIDDAFLKAEKQFVKFREKNKDHHKSVNRKSSIRKGLKLVKADIAEPEESEVI